MFDIQREELNWCGRDLVLETGRIARQADGAVFASWGETTVLATVVAAKAAKPGIDFFPLTCDYVEKTFAAAGFKPEAMLPVYGLAEATLAVSFWRSGIAPKADKSFSLNLTDAQMSRIILFTCAAIPAAVAVFGLGLWWKRRH